MSGPAPRPAAPVPPRGRLSPLAFLRSVLRADLSAFPERYYGLWLSAVRLPRSRALVANDPALIRRVLVERAGDYPKSAMMERLLSPLLGDSMFVSNGALWRKQRRMFDPSLSLNRLDAHHGAMVEAIGEALDHAARGDGTAQDADETTTRIAADIIFRTLVSLPLGDARVTELNEAFLAYQRLVPGLLLAEVARLPYWLLPWRNARARRAAKRVRTLLEPVIDARVEAMERGEDVPDDLLTGLIRARDPETGDAFSRRELVDEAAFLFLAGHETSASALSWALYLLAIHPEAQDRARAEVMAVADGVPSVGDLRRCKFARAVFRETLRLYPPVAFYPRDAAADDTMRGCPVRAGDTVMIAPWLVHRHRRIWRDPDLFDPERFLGKGERQAVRDAYIPFNAGPRVCGGASFATQEGVLALAMVLRRFAIEPVPERPPEAAIYLTLRSSTGTWLRRVPRELPEAPRPT